MNNNNNNNAIENIEYRIMGQGVDQASYWSYFLELIFLYANNKKKKDFKMIRR